MAINSPIFHYFFKRYILAPSWIYWIYVYCCRGCQARLHWRTLGGHQTTNHEIHENRVTSFIHCNTRFTKIG